MKYLVMECRPAYAVVLGDDGTFRKVVNMRYEVGQTVMDVVPLNLPEVTGQPKTNHRSWISSFAAMAACLVLVLSVFLTGQTPYASVYMTINPEVRIDVNRRDVVVGVEGMNDDGTQLLEGYAHQKKKLDTVMDELVDRAIDMGFLHEGGRITLSLEGTEAWTVSHSDSLNQRLNEHLTDKINVTIDIEQKQPEQTTPTAPAEPIVIPVDPDSYGESDYDDAEDSGYGSTDGEDSAYDEGDMQSGHDGPDSDYTTTGDGDSEYGQSDYETSDYGEPEDDGQTDYGEPEDDGQSDYSEPEDDGQSDYSEPEDDGQSDYGEPEDDGDSGYGQSDYETSDYDEPEDDGQTDSGDWPEDEEDSAYEDPSDYGDTEDDGQSDYDEPEDDSQTDYNDPDDSDSDEDSDYEADSDYGQSDSEEAEDGAVSDYDEPEDEDQSDYDDSGDTEEDSSDYDTSEENASDYEEAESDYEEN